MNPEVRLRELEEDLQRYGRLSFAQWQEMAGLLRELGRPDEAEAAERQAAALAPREVPRPTTRNRVRPPCATDAPTPRSAMWTDPHGGDRVLGFLAWLYLMVVGFGGPLNPPPPPALTWFCVGYVSKLALRRTIVEALDIHAARGQA